jgi:hypothetical protein
MMVTTRIVCITGLAWTLFGSLPGGRPAVAAETGWMLVESDPAHSDFLYDKSAVARSAEGVVTINAKVVYSPEGKAETLKALQNAKKYEGLAATEYRYEIMCGEERKSRLQRVVHYDGKGGRIAEFDLAGKTEWEDIPVSSRLDMVADEECPE